MPKIYKVTLRNGKVVIVRVKILPGNLRPQREIVDIVADAVVQSGHGTKEDSR